MNGDQALRLLVESFPQLSSLPPHSYVTGGALRDLVSGKEAVDIDITVPHAEDVARQFAARYRSRLVSLGRQPLLAWRITLDGRIYDFTDLIGHSIEEDLRRRDFTINAFALGPLAAPRLVDPYGGRDDLRAGLVRMVREENFVDDPLRMLRAVRFASTRRMEIEASTRTAIHRHSAGLAKAAPERISAELHQMFAADFRKSVRLLEELELKPAALPAGAVRAEELPEVGEADLATRWSVLFSRVARDKVEEYAERFRWSRQQIAAVIDLIELRNAVLHATDAELRPLLYDAGRETVWRARTWLSISGEREALDRLDEAVGDASLFDVTPLLTGTEIAELTGNVPGPKLGRLKRQLLEAQLGGEVHTHEEAIEFMRRRS